MEELRDSLELFIVFIVNKSGDLRYHCFVSLKLNMVQASKSSDNDFTFLQWFHQPSETV